MRERFLALNKKAGELVKEGYIVFSPISHSVPIADTITPLERELDLKVWLEQDFSFIQDWADEVWIYCLEGWEDSVGVAAEVEEARKLGLPRKFIGKVK